MQAACVAHLLHAINLPCSHTHSSHIHHRMAYTAHPDASSNTLLQVYKGRRRCTGQITAMKFIVKHGKSEKDIRNLRQEIDILRQLKHENIIQMLDAFETKTDFCVVTGAQLGLEL